MRIKKRIAACVLTIGLCLLLFSFRPARSPVIKGTLALSEISQIEKVADNTAALLIWDNIKNDFSKMDFSQLAKDAKDLRLKIQVIEVISPVEVHVIWGASPNNLDKRKRFSFKKGTDGWWRIEIVD